ncbi:MAG: hypothetical protein O3A01_07570 [bacterium]|nr:hypothetical protein [bacterium]
MLKRSIAGETASISIEEHSGKLGVRYFNLMLNGKRVGRLVATPQGFHSHESLFASEEKPIEIVRMDITIDPDFQGLGYGRQLLMAALSVTLNESTWVELIDDSKNGIGAQFYGGFMTQAMYNVRYNDEERVYTISPKNYRLMG